MLVDSEKQVYMLKASNNNNQLNIQQNLTPIYFVV